MIVSSSKCKSIVVYNLYGVCIRTCFILMWSVWISFTSSSACHNTYYTNLLLLHEKKVIHPPCLSKWENLWASSWLTVVGKCSPKDKLIFSTQIINCSSIWIKSTYRALQFIEAVAACTIQKFAGEWTTTVPVGPILHMIIRHNEILSKGYSGCCHQFATWQQIFGALQWPKRRSRLEESRCLQEFTEQ